MNLEKDTSNSTKSKVFKYTDNKTMRKTGLTLIIEERTRQIEVEGFDKRHDKQHDQNELAIVAACYALPEPIRLDIQYPETWDAKWWKPTPNDRVKELTKAGALIAAEIDRLLAEQEKLKTPEEKSFDAEWENIETKYMKRHGNWGRVLTSSEVKELDTKYNKLKEKYKL